MFPFWQIFLFLLCYLIGSIPWGPWICRRHGVDLSKVGSGNSGAANVVRALGWKVGLKVLGLDVLKGTFAVVLAEFSLMPSFLIPVMHVAYGTAAILGHNYSIFRRFKGGKGIATSLGVLLALSPKVAILAVLLYIGLVGLTRYSSLGSLGATAAVPILMVVYGCPLVYIGFSVVAAALAFHRHRENIQRLIDGTENQI